MNWQLRFEGLRSNKAFELFVVVVIIMSALLTGAKTYDLSSTTAQIIRFADYLITSIFVIELSVRYAGETKKLNFFKSAWNVFDTLIVTISLIPVDNSEMAVIGRLIRIFRVLRMVSMIPELRILLNSLWRALPQLGYVCLLLFIIYYIYAAIGSTLFADINPVLWGNISISLLTLFRIMTFEDWTDVMYETMDVYPLSWIFFVSFICFTAFAFLNMVIGIVVNVLEQENAQYRAETEPTLGSIQQEIQALRAELKQQSRAAKTQQ